MCPEPQLLSIYVDGELPSPWKEKMENHLEQCSGCMERLNSYRSFFEKTDLLAEQKLIEEAKDKVWQNLNRSFETSRPVIQTPGVWRRRVSIPLPAAAAAAIILVFLAALWIRGGLAEPAGNGARANMILASEEMPGIIPAADMNGVLQYLGSDGADILILRLPESRDFISSGEPAIIRAADYTRRRP
ncbi:MAG: zf-HC2 domain-containing protein [Treponema sp.]|jgi:anti-sigma factor RsiW|nr:zf-HC2 domain-containing protein [Treponema sp.]